jgi:soluble lytic murein transglycosylase
MAPTLFVAAVVILKQLVVTASLRVGLIFGLMLASLSPAQAEAAPSVAEQRSDYLEAMSAIKSRQKNKYRRLRANLTHYPLYPYLEYTDKIYSLIRQNSDSIQGFIDQWADTPLADQLRQNWLYYLAKHHRWNEFLAMYDLNSTTSINACFYGYALYKADRLPEAYTQAQTLWLVSRSQPEECDPLFKVWRDAGLLTDDMAWQRLQLAMADNKITLARYLLRFIGRADKSLARSYIDVHRRPELIRQTRRFSADNRRQRQIILHGIERLARRDAISALATMKDYQTNHEFDTAEIESTLTSIGIRLSRTGDPDEQLDSLPVTLTGQTQLLEARIRLALARRW